MGGPKNAQKQKHGVNMKTTTSPPRGIFSRLFPKFQINTGAISAV
jgi:hypothetical protein